MEIRLSNDSTTLRTGVRGEETDDGSPGVLDDRSILGFHGSPDAEDVEGGGDSGHAGEDDWE